MVDDDLKPVGPEASRDLGPQEKTSLKLHTHLYILAA
jgi:hypothetical protein